MLWGESKYTMFCLFYIMHIKNILARVVKRSCEQSSSGYQSVVSKRYAAWVGVILMITTFSLISLWT